jgi:flagellar biosynthesis protein FlhG
MMHQPDKFAGEYWLQSPILPRGFFEWALELYSTYRGLSSSIYCSDGLTISKISQESLPFLIGSTSEKDAERIAPLYPSFFQEKSISNQGKVDKADVQSEPIRLRRTDDNYTDEYLSRDKEYAQSAARDQARALRDLMAFKTVEKVKARTHARFLVVASGKGGVGKSTVALNLGIALSRQNKRVVVVDGDLGLANLDTMLGVRPKKTLWHYINTGVELSEILVKDAFGIDLLPGGSGLEDLANLSPAQTDRFISALENIESESDYIIIDTGAGINHRVITFAAAADRVILVAAPESTSILDAYGLIKVTCHHHTGQKFKVVMCRVQDGYEAKRHFDALAGVTVKYTDAMLELAGYIPNDESVKASVNQHQPLLVLYPRSNAAMAFYKLAQTISADVDRKNASEINYQTQTTHEQSGFIKRLLGALKPRS